MDMIRIDLAEVKSLCAHCRTLIAEGQDPATPIEAVRGETICFAPRPIRFWADRTVSESDRQSLRFTRFRPFDPGRIRSK